MKKRSFGSKIKALFGIKTLNEEFFEELEDTLIEGDLGARIAMEISDALRALASTEKLVSKEDLQNKMKEILSEKIHSYEPELTSDATNIFLVLGVNGVGKTTTIAKMAAYYKKRGERVLLAAGDTYRAAAIDQLQLHAERTDTRIVKQKDGSDPGAVIFDAIESAQARKDTLILADTAGRMHNKENLLRELQKIDKIITSKIKDPSCYKKFLVIDATTGQNGLMQAQLFQQAIDIDALILAKYDSASKGGTLIQIGSQLNIPVAFVGIKETYDDIHLFDKDHFIHTLIGIDE